MRFAGNESTDARSAAAVPFYLLIPLAAAIVYTVGSLYLKQASDAGVRSDAAFHLSNITGALIYTPLFFVPQSLVPHTPLTAESLWRAAVIGVLVYLGNRGTFAAIRLGDVSLINPLMGTKVILVAGATVILSGATLPGGVWVAAGLTTAGILLMGSRDLAKAGNSRQAILLVLASSVAYATSDALISKWSPGHGGPEFLGLLQVLVGIASALVILRNRASAYVPPEARPAFWKGCVLLNAQSLAFGIALAMFSDPAGANVVYGTRGLFAIAFVWFLGGRFGNRERATAGRATMFTRLGGASMITAAVVVAVMARLV